MSMRPRCCTPKHVDAERLKEQAAGFAASFSEAGDHASHTAAELAEHARELAEHAREAAVHAKESAVHAKDWAAPRVEAAIDWASPRVERAIKQGVAAAAPKVERAAERAVPLIDTAHDKLVDSLLPKLVAAVSAAAEAARGATIPLVAEPAPVAKKRHGARRFWLFALAAAIVRLLGDHQLADMVARAGHDLVHDRFCIQLMVNAVQELYDEGARAVRPREMVSAAG